MARRILDVIADVLTLLALTLAAVMHVAFSGNLTGLLGDPMNDLIWVSWVRAISGPNLIGSGICLGVLALLVTLSLVFPGNPKPLLARLGTLAMFLSAVGAMLFQVMLLVAYSRVRVPPQLSRAFFEGGDMLIIGVVATGCTIAFSLIRMIWTMPSFKSADVPPLPPDRDDVRAGRPLPARPEDDMLVETERVPNDEMRMRPAKEND